MRRIRANLLRFNGRLFKDPHMLPLDRDQIALLLQAARFDWRVADVLAAARSPIDGEALAAHFTGRGPWKKRLPQIVETLVSLGRARRVDGGVIGAN